MRLPTESGIRQCRFSVPPKLQKTTPSQHIQRSNCLTEHRSRSSLHQNKNSARTHRHPQLNSSMPTSKTKSNFMQLPAGNGARNEAMPALNSAKTPKNNTVPTTDTFATHTVNELPGIASASTTPILIATIPNGKRARTPARESILGLTLAIEWAQLLAHWMIFAWGVWALGSGLIARRPFLQVSVAKKRRRRSTEELLQQSEWLCVSAGAGAAERHHKQLLHDRGAVSAPSEWRTWRTDGRRLSHSHWVPSDPRYIFLGGEEIVQSLLIFFFFGKDGVHLKE